MKRQFKHIFWAGLMGLVPVTPVHALSWSSAVTFFKTMQDEVSAWSVTTSQTAVSAQQQNESQLRAQGVLATAIGAIEMSERVGSAIVAVDPLVGQPQTLLCAAQTEGQLRVEAFGQRDLDAARLMASFAGSRVSSSAAAQVEVLATRRERYCTVSEARAGACELVPNGMQGWDSNYAGFASQITLSPEGELAGYAYAAMVADTRVPAVMDCSSLECDGAHANQMRVAAMSTLAANSLVGQVIDRRVPILTGQ